jgi:hypothetical protein
MTGKNLAQSNEEAYTLGQQGERRNADGTISNRIHLAPHRPRYGVRLASAIADTPP